MKAKKDRCESCMYGTGPLRVYRCNYAGLTGTTRKAQPPEACTYFRRGKRLETPEEAARQQEARKKKACRRRPDRRMVAGGPDWEVGWTLYQKGRNDVEIARALGCGTGTVYKWRKRHGLPANAEPGWNQPKRRLRREERG